MVDGTMARLESAKVVTEENVVKQRIWNTAGYNCLHRTDMMR